MNFGELAAAQLAAYNGRDLEKFCACYSDTVRVLDADGRVTIDGAAAFREPYAGVFAEWRLGASVDTRLVLEPHVVDDERWWRTHDETGEYREGRVLVRYTATAGKISVVQFFRPAIS